LRQVAREDGGEEGDDIQAESMGVVGARHLGSSRGKALEGTTIEGEPGGGLNTTTAATLPAIVAHHER
jgi:hypothetical protein